MLKKMGPRTSDIALIAIGLNIAFGVWHIWKVFRPKSKADAQAILAWSLMGILGICAMFLYDPGSLIFPAVYLVPLLPHIAIASGIGCAVYRVRHFERRSGGNDLAWLGILTLVSFVILAEGIFNGLFMLHLDLSM